MWMWSMQVSVFVLLAVVLCAASTPVPKISDGTLSGSWKIKFNSNFTRCKNGEAPSHAQWENPMPYNAGQGMQFVAKNVYVEHGRLLLVCEHPGTGAGISSAQYDGAGSQGYEVKIGDYVEAALVLPGNAHDIYNYPTFWISGPDWPKNGEIDVVEVLEGQPTNNYQSPKGSKQMGDVFGGVSAVVNKLSTFGVYRGAKEISIYLNGHRVNKFASSDAGGAMAILLSVTPNGKVNRYGVHNAVQVEHVRAWSLDARKTPAHGYH